MESFNIKAVATYSGINAHTLRAWERRYGVIKPVRESNGRRRYSVAEAERLKTLAQLAKLGHAIGNLARLTDEELRALLHRSFKRQADVNEHDGVDHRERRPLKLVTTPEAISESCQRVLRVLADFNLDRLHRELTRAKAQHSVRSFVLDVALPLVVKVGVCVQSGQMSIAQEHALSAVLKSLLGEMMYSLQSDQSDRAAAENTFTVTLATQDGDMHEFGILMAGVLCAVHGVRCHYLGPDLPAASLVEAVNMLGGDVVLIGRTAVLSRGVRASLQHEYLSELHRALPDSVRIWVGGGLECDLAHIAGGSQASRDMRYMRSLHEFEESLRQAAQKFEQKLDQKREESLERYSN